MIFDVEHIAKLARIGISEDEKAKFAKDLTNILEFVKKLEEVNVDNVEPMSQATGLENRTRLDEGERKEEKVRKNILANAPEIKDKYIKVKAILE